MVFLGIGLVRNRVAANGTGHGSQWLGLWGISAFNIWYMGMVTRNAIISSTEGFDADSGCPRAESSSASLPVGSTWCRWVGTMPVSGRPREPFTHSDGLHYSLGGQVSRLVSR